MKVEYDKEADATYIYLEYPIKDGSVKKTKELSEDVIIDYDKNEKILGVEILNASKILTKKACMLLQSS